MIRKKCILVANSFAASMYLSNHIKVLNEKYQVVLFQTQGIEQNTFGSRNSFLNVLLELFSFIFLLICTRPSVVISVGTKCGMLCLISRWFVLSKHIHWFTGQRWALASSKYRSFNFYLDFLVYLVSTSSACDSHAQSTFLTKNFPFLNKKILYTTPGSLNGLGRIRKPSIKARQSKRVPLRVAYLGRKTDDKGLDDLYRVCELSEKRRIAVEFLLFGPVDGSSKEYSLFFNNPSRLSNFKLHDGWVDPASVFTGSDVLILLSRREGFGTVVIEAQAHGLPVVCTAIYGLENSLVDGVGGWKCEVGDISCCVEKLALLINCVTYQRISKQAIGFSRKFESVVFNKMLRSLYFDEILPIE